MNREDIMRLLVDHGVWQDSGTYRTSKLATAICDLATRAANEPGDPLLRDVLIAQADRETDEAELAELRAAVARVKALCDEADEWSRQQWPRGFEATLRTNVVRAALRPQREGKSRAAACGTSETASRSAP